MSAAYHYEPLKTERSTRVLELQPAVNLEAPLIACIYEVQLDSQPRYEALSYLWGERDPTRHLEIALEDGNSAGTIVLTPNCALALKHVRHGTNIKRLWVDAICINQQSMAEKKHQVPLMADIYTRADRVLVWLGMGSGSNKSIQDAFDFMAEVGDMVKCGFIEGTNSELERYDDSSNTTVDEATGSGAIPQVELDSMVPHAKESCQKYVQGKLEHLRATLRSLVHNRYFERVWTVQEIGCASHLVVCCRHGVAEWRDFVATLSLLVGGWSDIFYADPESAGLRLRDLYQCTRRLITHFAAIDQSLLTRLYTLDDQDLRGWRRAMIDIAALTSVITKIPHLKATQPLDRAYSMLWILELTGRNANPELASLPLWTVDYTKSTRTVYSELTEACILAFCAVDGQGQYFLNLACADHPSRDERLGLPSWVIDWGSESPDLEHWAESLWEGQFSATGSEQLSPTSIGFSSRSGRLLASGHRYARVTQKWDLGEHSLRDTMGLSLQAAAMKHYDRIAPVLMALVGFLRHTRQLCTPSAYGGALCGLAHALHVVSRPYKHSAISILQKPKPEPARTSDAAVQALRLVGDLFETNENLVRHPAKRKIAGGTLSETLSQYLPLIAARDVLLTVYQELDRTASLGADKMTIAELEHRLLGHKISTTIIVAMIILELAERNILGLGGMLELLLRFHPNKTLFFTDTGEVGLALRGLQLGDSVILWQGFRTPFLLRAAVGEVVGGPQLWTLVGSAYVHGVMHGEKWLGAEGMERFVVV